MSTLFLYQIHPDTEQAEMMGGACSLVIAAKDHFEMHDSLADDHILDDIITLTGRSDLVDHLDEIAEGMFVSDLPPDELRSLFFDIDAFEEAVLFETEI